MLTDTPTKDEIAAIEASKKLESVKKRVKAKKRKNLKKQEKTQQKSGGDVQEDAENNCFCLCCLESYISSKSNEKWVQCLECKGWSHEDGTGGVLQYVCHNCLSDYHHDYHDTIITYKRFNTSYVNVSCYCNSYNYAK